MYRPGLLFIFILFSVGCGGELAQFEGTWESGFSDTDEYGRSVSRSYLLKIDSDATYRLEYRTSNEGSWHLSSSGDVSHTRVSVDGRMRDGLQIGPGRAVRSGQNLNVVIAGELRTFRRQGWSIHSPCLVWIAFICLGYYGAQALCERFPAIRNVFSKGLL